MNGTHITGLGVLTLKLLPGSTGLAVELGFPSGKQLISNWWGETSEG